MTDVQFFIVVTIFVLTTIVQWIQYLRLYRKYLNLLDTKIYSGYIGPSEEEVEVIEDGWMTITEAGVFRPFTKEDT